MSMKVNKNGKEFPVGVIPKNYPASNIGYNNSQSGLSADNVQGAIDELVNNVENITIKQVELTTSSNVNDCIDEYTTYFITGSNRPINAPTNSSYNQMYWVRHFSGTTGIVQFCACRNSAELYMRFRWAGDWGSWVKFTVS